MVRFEEVLVATGHEEAGVLVFLDDRLVAVLVHLQDDHPVAPGCWYLEAGFGPFVGVHRTFNDLHQAGAWLSPQAPGLSARRQSVAKPT